MVGISSTETLTPRTCLNQREGTDSRIFLDQRECTLQAWAHSKAERRIATPYARGASKLRFVSSTMIGSISPHAFVISPPITTTSGSGR